jgi:zinc protease
VNKGLASSVAGGLIPTEQPFLYTLSLTATEGTSLSVLEEALVAELDRVRAEGITVSELAKAKHQLRARMVFENDSISNLAHQLGFFATIGRWQDYTRLGERIDAVTLHHVADVAKRRLAPANRTIGWFEPVTS